MDGCRVFIEKVVKTIARCNDRTVWILKRYFTDRKQIVNIITFVSAN